MTIEKILWNFLMKNFFLRISLILTLFCLPLFLNAQETGKEIENRLSAVKKANPGDYIVLRSGIRYILTAEEIAIARGEFDFNDLSNVKTEIRQDGTRIKTISQAHTVYEYPDGQSTHIIKTSVSFNVFMEYIEKNYHIARYIDYLYAHNDLSYIGSPRFNVFRARVEFQTISNDSEEIDLITATAYNHNEKNYIMKFTSKPNMVWGNTSGVNPYRLTGESRRVDFDTE